MQTIIGTKNRRIEAATVAQVERTNKPTNQT